LTWSGPRTVSAALPATIGGSVFGAALVSLVVKQTSRSGDGIAVAELEAPFDQSEAPEHGLPESAWLVGNRVKKEQAVAYELLDG
jgi:hypothetical protein